MGLVGIQHGFDRRSAKAQPQYWAASYREASVVRGPDRQEVPTLGRLALGGSFPGQPAEFVHELSEDARLSLEAIAGLADRLPRRSVICDTAAQPLLVPQGGPPRGSLPRPGDVIRNIGDAGAWLTLLNIEADPAYAELMHATLDQLEPGMLHQQGRMRNRVGFIFVSSPNSVTTARFDIEHSLLMQVRGPRRLASATSRVSQRVGTRLSATGTVRTGHRAGEHDRGLQCPLRRFHLASRQPGQSVPVDATKVAAMRARGDARHVRSGVAARTMRRDASCRTGLPSTAPAAVSATRTARSG